jgi:hypothetical protein
MNKAFRWVLGGVGILFFLGTSNLIEARSVTVPIVLDHNRMLVDAEFQRKDGSWRKALVWVDTGNPDFILSEELARDLGIDLSAREKDAEGNARHFEVPPPAGVRIGGMLLDFGSAKSEVLFQPSWLFLTMHCDANLPSTVLMKYQVVLDYPRLRATIAKPGSLPHRGARAAAGVNRKTGIVQIDAIIAGDRFSFALDNGASYSFVSGKVLERLSLKHHDWPRSSSALGCANIWGWWPEEPSWPVLRVPDIRWGPVRLENVGIVGLPNIFGDDLDLGAWYSKKAAAPVDGFLGPNAFKAFRVEMDYANNTVYFEKGAPFDTSDMNLVGLALRLNPDGGYQVIGVAGNEGAPAVEGVRPGDRLLEVDNLEITGVTMGTAVDALRGKPGDVHDLLLEREGKSFRIKATVRRFL